MDSCSPAPSRTKLSRKHGQLAGNASANAPRIWCCSKIIQGEPSMNMFVIWVCPKIGYSWLLLNPLDSHRFLHEKPFGGA